MFVPTYSLRVISAIVCTFVTVTALPLVARSQVTEPAQVIDSSSSDEVVVVSDAVEPYVIEGIPAGDSVAGDFVVGPGKADITIKPGESKVVFMTVTNRTGERRIFNITVEDAEGSNDQRTPIKLLGNDRGPYSLKDYVSVPAYSFELGHNLRARVPVTITIPPDAEPGGRYGSVLIDTVAIESNAGDTEATVPQSAIVARVGTLFFVTIPGEIERDSMLTQFGTIGGKQLYANGPIPFGILIKNNGSMHVTPSGEIRVVNMFGNEVGSVDIETWFILPKSERLREISWDREFLFGKYTATAHISRGYDGIVDTATFSFWVLPWKPLALGFAVLFTIIFLTRAFFRTFEFKRKT
jgi:hypothetical protein